MPTRKDRITHFIPPENFAPVSHEFVEPVADDYFIHWLFGYRCIECKRRGEEINEINPRSRSKNNLRNWKNRVVLCRTCHEKFHRDGVTSGKIKAMQEMRTNYLISMDRGRYL